MAWVLTSVFIRFCEDNALVAPVWIAGPENRRQEALDAQLAYFRAHPEHTDREWLQAAIDYVAGLPATKGLVDSHSALHLVSPSGDAVTKLLEFWRDRHEDGTLVHDLPGPSLSTRFLGDLYQDLSQHAKDTYALLQTPVFVEEFILDRTLEPALKERPLEGFRLVDPTCGSGHFLLGAFDRLLDRWNRHAPGLEIQARVQQALDAIHGIDLNPFAIAVARFRLTVAALKASGLTSLEKAPAFTFHLAVGDSLIHGPDPGVLPGMSDRTAFMPFTYATEDGPLLLAMLEEGRYDVVVGNPPYIAVKDKALNQIYRSKYADVCKGKYALTVPFMKLFFNLAKKSPPAGWVGQITANSFMKREFGAPLIESFLALQDLRLIADTSGAYIPGHGIPTVILVGRNQRSVLSTVRAVLGVRSEPTQPDNPAKGIVWSSIVQHIDDPSWDDGWVTITDLDRSLLTSHPWSLSGGGASELRTRIEREAVETVANFMEAGVFGMSNAEPIFHVSANFIRRRGITTFAAPLVSGPETRDWATVIVEQGLFPYDKSNSLVPYTDLTESVRAYLWPFRTILGSRATFSGPTYFEMGKPWWSWHQVTASRFSNSSVGFVNVATHNHFVAIPSHHLYSVTVPILQLTKSYDRAPGLLGVLNSSTVCFWLKQVCHDKAGSGIGRGSNPKNG